MLYWIYLGYKENGRYVKERMGALLESRHKLVHFRQRQYCFHCIISCDVKSRRKLYFADNVPANEFLNLEGNKLSTSKNWAVWLHEYLVDFPGQQDVLRYIDI
jgi:methionyl-tRNA synthetase